jgi:membrane protein
MRAMLGDRLWEVLRRYRAGRALTLLIDNLDHHHVSIGASAIAFDAFLSLVPLAAFAGLVLHVLHENGAVLIGPILSASPRPVAELVEGAVGRLSDSTAAVIAPVSVVAFIWTSSGGIATALSVFETMFHSPPRPWWWRRGIGMLCVLASIAIIAATTAITVGVGMVSGRLAALIPVFTLVGLLMAFFRIAVRGSPLYARRRVLPGVLVTILLWAIVSALFSFYVTTLSRYATLYGGLAAVAIFLFWLWLLAMALLVGGEVNAQLDGVRDTSSLRPKPRPPAEAEATAAPPEGSSAP